MKTSLTGQVVTFCGVWKGACAVPIGKLSMMGWPLERRYQPAPCLLQRTLSSWSGLYLRRYQFTSKLESMFTDIKTSRDAMQSFKQHQANAASTSGAADDIDLAVQVL